MSTSTRALVPIWGFVIAFGLAGMGCQNAVDRLFTLKTYEPGGYSYNYDCISEDDLRKVRLWWLEDMKPRRKTTYFVAPHRRTDSCIGLYSCQFWRTKYGWSNTTRFYPILRFEDRIELYQFQNDSANLRTVEEFIDLYRSEFSDSVLTFIKARFMVGGYNPHTHGSRRPRRDN